MRRSSSNEYLPTEVFIQILVNLPVKTLLRCRCVCKSWCSIIDDPYFVNLHSKLCNTNKNKHLNSTELLSFERSENFRQRGCSLTIRKADTLCNTLEIFKSSECFVLHGSCNSLILISLNELYGFRGMRICNPSIRKSLLLPNCPLNPWFEFDVNYVLGFAPQSKDFKVIAISTTRIRSVSIPKTICLAVCTLSDQQWIVRDNDDFNLDCLSSMRLLGPYYFCDGAAQWVGRAPCEDSSNQDNKSPTHLVSLDFDTERFTFLELPQALDGNITLGYLFLLGESLAYFCISGKLEGQEPSLCRWISWARLSIWVLKQERGKREWSLWFSGPSSVDGFKMFNNNSYNRSITQRVLYFDGDNDNDRGYLVCGRRSYNIATGQVQSLNREVEVYRERLVLYYESLVLCKGYGVEDMTASPIRWGE